MKRLSITLALAALLGANTAHSEIFKCTSPQGKVSYASIPCDETAQSALQRQGPPNIRREGEPLDYVHKTNLKATEYLKVGGRTRVTVYETERYKAYQRNRPPAPNVPSQCQSPLYNSQCFDPSGGMSSKKQTARQDGAR
ncbi:MULTISPECIES: DUF4124 domain-containing protein [Pseudomonas syringae group]|uniref:DUF4124 domain-containing protein n=2 Tax=Pseudomonas syringae group TaxID=136849 RepID=A0AAE6UL47_9PSED|nr:MULTISPECIES: DUF4124 domain-containing protein [Pseudomonas syringae group]KPW29071.1 Uncharacterized protein ALO66_00936 [Pseudomonas coronafaciens pv. atropurpurea]KPX32467.1 Uncharacterized protein ALO77_03704 [Pseudomonas coronafaciens pv. garcae]KPY95419.1 Uncharacterized protein ALO43_01977 [Pseudomonas tremae]KPZ28469.1 Uncharacterized protein ALO38_04919 [Pseudomonas coronafaciens pv. zizaniae]MCF5713751.1 DUF4124 domain-containing protein [Pseudomonas tremae]